MEAVTTATMVTTARLVGDKKAKGKNGKRDVLSFERFLLTSIVDLGRPLIL